MHEISHIAVHGLEEASKTFSYLFLAYLLLEWLAHGAKEPLKRSIARFGSFGSLLGALFGLLPQCGFSVAMANFYKERVITPGALFAVFLATSDEALPVLLAKEIAPGGVLTLLAVKFVIAVAVGLFADFALRGLWVSRWKRDSELAHNHDGGCGCSHDRCRGNIFLVAFVHAAKITGVVFAVTVAIHLLDGFIERGVSSSAGFFQPLCASLAGLVPSCASSVLLVELYLAERITFGALLAGLLSGSGAGTLVLLQSLKSKREALLILSALVAIGASAGVIADLMRLSM